MSRYRTFSLCVLTACLAGCGPSREAAAPQGDGSMYTLITLDPAHFHAALVQKEMYPGV